MRGGSSWVKAASQSASRFSISSTYRARRQARKFRTDAAVGFGDFACDLINKRFSCVKRRKKRPTGQPVSSRRSRTIFELPTNPCELWLGIVRFRFSKINAFTTQFMHEAGLAIPRSSLKWHGVNDRARIVEFRSLSRQACRLPAQIHQNPSKTQQRHSPHPDEHPPRTRTEQDDPFQPTAVYFSEFGTQAAQHWIDDVGHQNN